MKRRLVGFVLALVVGAFAFVSHSILTPLTGVNHIYYGAKWTDFLTEQLVTGDINGDTRDDIITGIYWDDPAPGGPPRAAATCVSGAILVTNDVETVPACTHLSYSYWATIGYRPVNDPPVVVPCDSCYWYPVQTEDQGAGFVFYGGNYDGVPLQNDLNTVSPGLTIYGQNAGDKLLFVATGRVSVGGIVDQYYDILLGAPQWQFYQAGSHGPYYVQQGRGEAFVIRGSATLPSTIDLRIPSDSTAYVHKYFSGRDIGDRFAYSNALGNINGGLAGDEIIISSPWGDGANNLRNNSGEVYIFYPGASLPSSVDLSTLSDAAIAGYAQVIYGASAGDYLGIANVALIDQGSNYAPPSIAVGDWDQDGIDDLVLGAGNAFADDRGAVYIIFGAQSGGKLVPGNTIDLSLAPGTAQGACDMVFYGVAAGDALGTGVELTDVDFDGSVKKDLLLGAALADNDDGGATIMNRGEAYIAFGATRTTLTTNSVAGVRDLSSGQFSSYVDVVVYGDDAGDQFGAYFAGNGDFDLDQYHDFVIGGRYATPDDATGDEWGQAAVFFGKSRAAWTADNRIHLKTALYNKAHRIFKIVSEVGGESNKVRLAKIDLGDNADLVFGGYDADGYNPTSAVNAGQMYIMKGRDVWKSGTITGTQTWRDNVFVTGDLTIAQGATVTLEPGTDVYVWPFDWGNSGVDASQVEVHVNGSLQAIGNPNGVNGLTNRIQFIVWSDSLKAKDRDAWWGIFVHDVPGASATFDYCTIANATYGLQANVDVTIKNSTIEYCDELGLSVAGGDSVYAEHLTIHDVGYAGVNMLQGMRVRLNDCELYNMGDYGVKAYSGARLYANDTTIKDADLNAVSVSGQDTFADIDDCIFENNYRGLRVEGDIVASIDGSTIDESENYGVFALYDAVLSVNGCTIKNASAGIAAFESGVAITGSTMRDNGIGLEAFQGSTPSAENCDIIYNGIGVLAMQGGNPNLGDDVLYGSNEIHHSTTYHVSNISPGITVKAENNYWKNSTSPCWPPSSKINGSVDYNPAVCDPPAVSLQWPLETGPLPDKYGLSQNYPNPFNPTTRIPYAVPSPGGKVTIAIYNVRGQLVRTLVGGTEAPGYHSVLWDGTNNQGSNTSSGVYFVLMRAGGFQQTRKLVLLK